MENARNTEALELAMIVGLGLIGTQYKWAGDDPMSGFDCSGLVVELLQSSARIASDEDLTAEMLRHRFPKSEKIMPGTLLFWDWNKDGKADHVEIVINMFDSGEIMTIGASGGNQETTNEENAKARNAFVKIRQAVPGFFAVVDPFTV